MQSKHKLLAVDPFSFKLLVEEFAERLRVEVFRFEEASSEQFSLNERAMPQKFTFRGYVVGGCPDEFYIALADCHVYIF